MQAIAGNIVGKVVGNTVVDPEFRNKTISIANDMNRDLNIASNEVNKALSIANSEISPILSKFLPESFINFYPKFHILCFILGLLLMIILYSLNQINYNKDDFF